MKKILFLKYITVIVGMIYLIDFINLSIGYNIFIHQKTQGGGWSIYRFKEYLPQFVPFFLFSISVLTMALIRTRNYLFKTSVSIYILSTIYLSYASLFFIHLFGFSIQEIGLLVSLYLPIAWLIVDFLDLKKRDSIVLY
jgi:hypothetical protein